MTGNLSEDADYMFTIFNPNDEKFHLSKHFGMDLKDRHNNPLYPNLRTIHLVESRHTFYPQHFKTIMRGNLKAFELLKTKAIIPDDEEIEENSRARSAKMRTGIKV